MQNGFSICLSSNRACNYARIRVLSRTDDGLGKSAQNLPIRDSAMLTDEQQKALDDVEKYGNMCKAAKARGQSKQSFARLVKRAKANLARQGYAPEHDMVKTCPDGYHVKGVSTLYTNGEHGTQVSAQWVKTNIDRERQDELMREAVAALSEDIKRAKPVPAPKPGQADLLNAYVITDYHLGMRAWPEETGSDWDTDKAEQLLYDWFSVALHSAPSAETGLLIQLGDWLHFDGLDAVTPTGGHLLDADTRFQKLVRVTIRAFRRIVAEMLRVHQRVHIVMAEGNHDLSASAWMRELFAAHYDTEPRVTIDTSPDPYYCFEFGANSIFAHHGHKKRMDQIDKVFTSKFREVFGRTVHSHAHLGHLHHERTIESQLMLVEQHRTLASPDSYASRGGWISGRSAKVITYHCDYGKVGELQISPDMV